MKHLKKLLSLFLCAVMLLSLLPPSAVRADSSRNPELNLPFLEGGGGGETTAPTEPDNCDAGHNYVDGVCTRCQEVEYIGGLHDNLSWRYYPTSQALVILGTGPMAECEYPWDYPWNQYLSRVDTITIEEGVTTIGSKAFGDYDYMGYISFGDSLSEKIVPVTATKITMADTVTSIGECAFAGCTNLTELVLSRSLVTIGKGAFRGCNALPTLVIPGSVGTICERAFYACYNLTSVVICGNVTFDGSYQFNSCSKLSCVHFMGTMPVMNKNTFGFCASDLVFHYDDMVTGWENCTYSAFPALIFIESGCKDTLYTCAICGASFTDNGIPLASHTFEKVETVEPTCKSSGYTVITCTVCSYSSTKDVVPALGHDYVNGVCTRCQKQENFESGTYGQLTWIYDTIEKHLVISGNGPMENGNYVRSYPWVSCLSDVVTITVEEGVTSIGDFAFASSIMHPIWDGSPDVVLANLTTVTLPDTLETIGDYAFAGCGSLKDLYLGEGVSVIQCKAFATCLGLSSVWIPASVSKIEKLAFEDCSRLCELHFLGTMPDIASNAFDLCHEDLVLCYGIWGTGWRGCPFTAQEALLFGGGGCTGSDDINCLWCGGTYGEYIPHNIEQGETVLPTCKSSGYTVITCTVCSYSSTKDVVPALGHDYVNGVCTRCQKQENFESGTYGQLTWIYDTIEKHLVISGNGPMENGNYVRSYPWASCLSDVVTITVEEGVTSIGDFAFATSLMHPIWDGSPDVVLANLTTVTLPDTLETIGDYAFAGCGSLKDLYLGEGVSVIQCKAFATCLGLSSVWIPASVSKIEKLAFEDCSRLCELHFLGTMPDIDSNVFGYRTSVPVLHYPQGATGWDSCSFQAQAIAYEHEEGCQSSYLYRCTCGSTYGSLLPHSYNAVTIAPACEDKGYTVYTCTVCGHSYQDKTVPALGHDFVEWHNSFCESEGYIFDRCKRCNLMLLIGTIPPTGHTFPEEGVYIPPTCSSDGYTRYQCIHCYFYYPKDFIPALPHDFVDNVCTRCNAKAVISGTYGELSWAYTDLNKTLVISGNGPMLSSSEPGYYPWGKYLDKISYIVIEEGVTSIGDFAFGSYIKGVEPTMYYTSPDNVERITLPNSLESIGNYAFAGCSEVKHIFMGTGVKTIGDYAFYGWRKIRSLTLPAGVTSIGTCAFAGWSQLKHIHFLGDMPQMSPNIFSSSEVTLCYVEGASGWENCTYTSSPWAYSSYADCYGEHYYCKLCYVRQSFKAPTTQAHRYNSEVVSPTCTEAGHTLYVCSTCGYSYTDDIVMPHGHLYDAGICVSCTYVEGDPQTYGRLNWSYSEKTQTLSIYGSGPIYTALSPEDYPWYPYLSTVTTIVIGNSVTSIGNYAFAGSTLLTNLSLGTGVTAIGVGAFASCDSLVSVTFSESLASIGASAFKGCDRLRHGHFLGAQPTIAQEAFDDCASNLTLCYLEGAEGWSTCSYPIKLWRYTLDRGCSGRGIGLYVCNTCAGTYGSAVNHAYTSKVTRPTCLEGGYTTYTCRYCTDSFQSNPVDPLGHDYVATCTPPTCTAEGYTSYTCNNCSHTYRDSEVPVIPHSYENGVCSGCGDAEPITGTWGQLEWSFHEPSGIFTIAGSGDMATSDKPSTKAAATADGSVYPWNSFRSEIKTLIIEDGITSIGDYAFAECANLTEVSMGSTVEDLGSYAFRNCNTLEEITLPDSLTTIGNYAFYYCSELESVDMGDCVTTISDRAFARCSALTEIEISNSVTSIGVFAFIFCSELETVTIPESVETIRYGAFAACDSLESILVSEENPYFSNDEEGVLFNKDQTTLILYPAGREGSYEIPSSVTALEEHSFYQCAKIIEVTIPDSVTELGSFSFCNCTGLETVTMGSGITTISTRAFDNCASLETVTIPDSVTAIEANAFSSCNSLETLTIPDSVTTIGSSAFASCASLTDVTLGEGLTSIGASAFKHCPALEEVYFPGDMPSMGSDAFFGCDTELTLYYAEGAEGWEDCTYETEVVHRWNEGTVTTEPTCSSTGICLYTCSDCGITKEEVLPVTDLHTYEKGLCIRCGQEMAPVTDPSLKIMHSLNLASDISVNLAVPKNLLTGYLMDTVYMECALDVYEGNTKTGTKLIRISPVEKDNYYYFTLTGLTAVHMNDEIRSTLYGVKGEQRYCSNVDLYSIATYAYTQMDKAAMPETFRILCADLLRYGAKAQIFKNYRTDTLADSNLTNAQLAYQSDLSQVTFGNNNRILEDLDNAPIQWEGKSLSLDAKVCLKFVFSMGTYTGSVSDLSLRVRYSDANGAEKTLTVTTAELYNESCGYYAFTVDALLAAELRSVVSVQIFAGDTPLTSTLEYSADTYGNNKTGDLLDLCKALFAYSDSAKAFFAN